MLDEPIYLWDFDYGIYHPTANASQATILNSTKLSVGCSKLNTCLVGMQAILQP